MPDVCLDMRPAIAAISGPLVFIIAPETFEKLVLIAVIAAGAELLRDGFFS
jgi:threonine/homoserine efflux transporter RhtA